MARYDIEARARAAAPRQTVWDLLADSPGWARWGPWDQARLEREGDPSPGGRGALRVLVRRPVTVREEVVAFDPPERYGYELRSGLPVRGHRAEITLTSVNGGGTEIAWRSGFESAPLGSGPLLRAWLQRVVAEVVERLAREADRRAAAHEMRRSEG